MICDGDALEKPTILLSFPFVESSGWHIPLGEACAQGLAALGFGVERFNPVVQGKRGRLWKSLERTAVLGGRLLGQSKAQTKARLPWLEEPLRYRAIVDLARRTRPTYLFNISTFTYPPGVLAQLRDECGVRKTIGWCVEGPTWINDPNREAALYDHYFCIHRRGITHPAIENLPALGFDPCAYQRLEGEAKTRALVFVGRKKERRVAWLAPLADQGLEVYGPEWEKSRLAANLRAPGVFGRELTLLYNRSQIVLNVSAWDNDESACLNLRILDVPACGAMLLTDHAPGIEDYLQPDREVVVAHSPEEMRDKARYYLTHDAERERIALAGWEKVQKMETYAQKMRRMISRCQIPIPADGAS